MQMSCKQYTIETKVVSSNGSTDSNSNSITFINTGSVAVNVDNVILQPGQQLAITGNENEICVKIFYYSFATGANPALSIIYKRYL